MFSLMFWLVIILNIDVSNSQTRISRSVTCSDKSKNHFCKSHDRFTNYDQQLSFCLERNATCASSVSCQQCECRPDYTFVSFKHGCVNSDDAKKILEAEPCFSYQHLLHGLIYIPTAHDTTFSECRYLFYPKGFSYGDLNDCMVKQTYVVNVFDGEKEAFGDSKFRFYKPHSSSCLTCEDYSCDLQPLHGSLVYLDLRCGLKSTKLCFMFKVDGEYSTTDILTNFTRTVQPTDQINSDTSKSDVTVVIVISCVVTGLLVLCVIVLLVCYRRRSRRNRENSFAFEAGKRGDIKIPLYEDIPSPFPATRKISNEVLQDESRLYTSVEVEQSDVKNMESDNIYYTTTDADQENNSLASKKVLESNINGPDTKQLNVRTAGYDQVGTVIPTTDISDQECLKLNNRKKGYDDVGSIIPSAEISDNECLKMNHRERGYDDVGSIIASTDDI